MIWDLAPLIEQVKLFNSTQTLILQELQEIKNLLQKNAFTTKESKN